MTLKFSKRFIIRLSVVVALMSEVPFFGRTSDATKLDRKQVAWLNWIEKTLRVPSGRPSSQRSPLTNIQLLSDSHTARVINYLNIQQTMRRQRKNNVNKFCSTVSLRALHNAQQICTARLIKIKLLN